MSYGGLETCVSCFAPATDGICSECGPAGHEWLDGLQADWRYEIANGDTRLGFTEWYEHRMESERILPQIGS